MFRGAVFRSILISRPLSEQPDTLLVSTELDWEHFWFPFKEIELGSDDDDSSEMQ